MEDMNNVKNSMNQNIQDVEVPTLTLNPEERTASNIFAGPSLESMHLSNMQPETGVSAGSVDESMLSPEEKRQVEEFVKQIDVTDIKMVNTFGSSAQNSISAFSSSITDNVRTKEFGDVGKSLQDLRAAIDSTVVPEKKGIFGLFQKGKQKVTYLISSYESAEVNIKKIEKQM